MGQSLSITCPPCLGLISSLPRFDMQLLVLTLIQLRPVSQATTTLSRIVPLTEKSFGELVRLLAGDRESLDSLELAVLFLLVHGESTALDKAHALLEIFDLNGDGRVSVEELGLLRRYVARCLSVLLASVVSPNEILLEIAESEISSLAISAAPALATLPGRSGNFLSPDRVRISDQTPHRTGGLADTCPVHMTDPRKSRTCRLLSESEILLISRFIEVIKAKTAYLLDGKSRKLVWSEICRLVQTCLSEHDRKSDLALLVETISRPVSNLKSFITASRAEALRVVTLRDLLALVCPCASHVMLDSYLVFYVNTLARPHSPMPLLIRPLQTSPPPRTAALPTGASKQAATVATAKAAPKVKVAVSRAVDVATAALPTLESGAAYADALLRSLEEVAREMTADKNAQVPTTSAMIDLETRRAGDNRQKMVKASQELANLQTTLEKISLAKTSILERIDQLTRSLSVVATETQTSADSLAALADPPILAETHSQPAIVRAFAEDLLGHFGHLGRAVAFVDRRHCGHITCADLLHAVTCIGLNDALVSDAFRALDLERLGRISVARLLRRLSDAAGRVADLHALQRDLPRPDRVSRTRSETRQPLKTETKTRPDLRARSTQPTRTRQVPDPVSHGVTLTPGVSHSPGVSLTPGVSCGEERQWALGGWEVSKLRFESRKLKDSLRRGEGTDLGEFSEFGTWVRRRREAGRWAEFARLSAEIGGSRKGKKKTSEEVVFLRDALTEVLRLQKTLLREDTGNFTGNSSRRRARLDMEGLEKVGLQASEAHESESSEESEAGEEERRRRKKREAKEDLIYQSRLFLKDTKPFVPPPVKSPSTPH